MDEKSWHGVREHLVGEFWVILLTVEPPSQTKTLVQIESKSADKVLDGDICKNGCFWRDGGGDLEREGNDRKPDGNKLWAGCSDASGKRGVIVGSVFTCSNKVTRVAFVLHRKLPHADRSDQSQSSSLCDASTAISYLFSITPFGFLIMPELMILILILVRLQL